MGTVMSARDLILAWIRQNGKQECWLLGLFRHLTDNGVPPDAAIAAMERFVEEVIEVKRLATRPPLRLI
jgi:hypothetical protein